MIIDKPTNAHQEAEHITFGCIGDCSHRLVIVSLGCEKTSIGQKPQKLSEDFTMCA